MNQYRSRPVAVLLGLALLASACSSDGTDDNADNNAAVETETTAAITTPPTTDGGVGEADGPDEAEGGSPASTNAPTAQAPGQVEPEPTPNVVDSPAILTAYLGVLDLPAVGVGLLAAVSGCEQQPLDEGMPVVLSHRVDGATLEPSDFAVTTARGAAMTPTCATLEPATDDDELQTVLLTGPLGSADDPPAEVAVVGELLAIDGTVLTGIATDTINTFETGPRLVLARLDPADEQCAALGSSHEIQMTWEGGVTGPRGTEPGTAELEGLTLIDVDGGSHPLLGFDDLGDGDNYLVACAPPDVEPATLEARRDTVYDPTNNPNPPTVVEVESRTAAITTPPTTDGGVGEADGPDEAEGGSPASTNAPGPDTTTQESDEPEQWTQESVQMEVGEYTFDAIVAGPDDGAVVFLLHGFPQTNQSWDEVIPVLAEAGYRVVAPNLRGYSPGARPLEPELYTMDLHTADVIGMTDALGVDQFHVVGHDWGAAATWSLAMSHPDRVLSIVPVSGAHPQAIGAALAERAAENDGPQGGRLNYVEVFAAEGAEEMFLENDAAFLRQILSGPWFTEEEVENYVDHFNEPGAMTGALNWLRSGSRGVEIAPVTIPTMSVWSTEDITLGRIGAELSGDYVEGPYRVEALEGVSHWIPDEAPDELNALLLEHLETYA